MEVLKAITKRKSVRAYKPEQVPDDILDKILCAGSLAPVGMRQYDTMHFTVIQDKDILSKISTFIQQMMKREGDPLYGLSTLVLISSKEQMSPGFDYVNAGGMMENMALAAVEYEIGSVILWGTALAVESNNDLKQALSIPEGFHAVSSIGLGYALKQDSNEKEMTNKISTNRV